MIYEMQKNETNIPTNVLILGAVGVTAFYFKDKIINFVDGILGGERDVEEDGRFKHEQSVDWRQLLGVDVNVASIDETKSFRVL